MCSSNIQRSTGGIVYTLGLLVAGVMFIVIGSEYNDDSTDYDHLRDYFWVYAIAHFVGTCGLILDNGGRFCGEEEIKDVEYFGGLFQVVAGFAWAGFGVGLARYYESAYVTVGADERGSLAYLSGVAAIFFGFGAILTLKKLICCEGGFQCNIASIIGLTNTLLSILLIIFWFLFADKLEEDPASNAGDDDRRTFSYLLGIIYILMSFGGVGPVIEMCCGSCCGGSDKPNDNYGPKDNYGNEPEY